MRTRIIPIVLSLLLFVHCKPEQEEYVINPAEFIYGQWRCKKHMWWKYTKLTDEQVNAVMTSILHIEHDKIFLEGIDFIEPHNFLETEIRIAKFNENDIDDVYSIKGPFRTHYTKHQIRQFDRIELGGKKYGLGVLYLDKDTLILDHYGGVAFFMEKIPAIETHYQGENSSIQALDLAKPYEFVKLTYSVKGTPAQLKIKDQLSKRLLSIIIEGNEQTKTVRVPLAKVTQLIFEISSSRPDFEWNTDALVY